MNRPRICAIIPAYRASETLKSVVARCLTVADHVVVIDDACPESSGATLEGSFDAQRLTVIRRPVNGGVGAATKDGMAEAIRIGATYVVKVDADGQMDPDYVPAMISCLETRPDVDLVKGNRFADGTAIERMPRGRLIGNAGLTFLVKFSSGYWTIVDPTNGFIAMRVSALKRLNLSALADRYFFEIDLLCALGLWRREIGELEMPAIYGKEKSSLSMTKALFTFPGMLLQRFFYRILINYFVVEINVGTICGLVGLPLFVVALIFGGHEWALSSATGQPRATGTIILALLMFIFGFQLSLQALLYDVQFSARTVKIRADSIATDRD